MVIGPLGNYLISMFKDTSLASIVTLKELMFQGEILAAATYRSVPIFILVGAVYLALSYPSSLGIQALERRLKTRRRRPVAAGTPESEHERELHVDHQARPCRQALPPSAGLRDVNLDVVKGEVVVVIGRSGSGKSTMLYCINHLEDITDGTIYIEGKPAYRYKVDGRWVCDSRNGSRSSGPTWAWCFRASTCSVT